METFRRELWKDERTFPRVGGDGVFVKDCFSEGAARLEYDVLALLVSLPGERLCPEPIRVDGSQLAMRTADGMRLFEVLRCLREIELSRRDGAAEAARQMLMSRQRHRLARIQTALFGARQTLDPTPYPMAEKMESLFGLLTRILDVTIDTEAKRSIGEFADYWRAECAQVPFRDATPKNTIVEHPLLTHAARRGREDGDTVATLVDMDGGTWQNVVLRDIDFASAEHLTSFEDDPISLHCHEWTYGSCPVDASALLLLPTLAQVDPFRTAASLLVRYLRFGGRKLAYRLINAGGFEIRFRFDDPLFYFRRIIPMVDAVCPAFAAEFAPLLELFHRIGAVAGDPSPADRGILQIDHFRSTYGFGGDYWHENPRAGDDE